MIVADRRATLEILKDAGFKNVHSMTNAQLAECLRFLARDSSAQVTNEFSDGFLWSLRQALTGDMGLSLSEDSMPAKIKQAAKAAARISKKAPPKALTRPPYKTSRKSPGICRFILGMLKKASSRNPITKPEILKAMVQKFPHRDPAKMANTLSKVSWWIYHDLGHELKKNENGYWARPPKEETVAV